MQLHVKTGFALLAACCASVFALAQNASDAQEILRRVRLNQSEQHRALDGRLRVKDAITPFHLALAGGEIRYEFRDPAQTISVRLAANGAQLFEETKGSTQKVSAAKFDDKVRGTDISYEDLALRFLYWPKAKIDGEEMKLTRRCWKLHLEPGGRGDSQYAVVLLWVEKESGAFLQAEGYDAAGKIAKRFKVISGQKIGGEWMLKQMRIETLSDASRDRTPTYLEIEKPDRQSD